MYAEKSVHRQMFRYVLVFLVGNMFPVIFFHTHFAKEYDQKNYMGNFHIYMKGRHVKLKALVDTGNHLYEPITGKPVCLVEYESIKHCLNLNFMEKKGWMIPYHTIGKSQGMLWGFTADKVVFQNKGAKIIKCGCIIAKFSENMSKSGDYSAIIHPDILEK